MFQLCSSIIPFTIPSKLLLSSSLLPDQFNKYFKNYQYHPYYNSLSSDYYCNVPNYQLLSNEWIHNNNSLDATSIYTSLTSSVVCDIHNTSSPGNTLEGIPDFSEIFKKLDRIQGTVGQLGRKYYSISDVVSSTKKNNKMIRYTLEGFSLEIYGLYKKIGRLEERLMYTIQAKSSAMNYRFKKSLEREERILKVLYDHMTQLYNTQIEFIQQVNSIISSIEKPQNHGISPEYMKQKYLLLQQQMNKYKMMLTAFELPLNLLVDKDSIPYFEDFLQFIKSESKTLGDYIHILNWKDPSLSHFNKKDRCIWKSPLEHLTMDNECPLNQPPSITNSNHEVNIFYELYQIYHERLLKLKQENQNGNKINQKFFDEMNEMRHQISNVHSIIETLSSNQRKLESKFKSIEQLLTLSSPSFIRDHHVVSHIPSQNNLICFNNSPDFYNTQTLTYSLDQCPLFNNGFVDLVYQYVMKKIQETDHGVDRPDYALRSSGGYILHTHTSRTYRGDIQYEDYENDNLSSNHAPLFRKNNNHSFIKTLLSKYLINAGFSPYLSPELVLDPHIFPGYGWVMNGSSGYITIGLAKPIYPKSITIDHIPSNLNLESSMASAPRYIEVLGIYDIQKFKANSLRNKNKIQYSNKISTDLSENDNAFILIPVFEFNPEKSPSSTSLTIPVPENIYIKIKKPIQYLHVKILSNWGNTKYTSIYRIRIH